MDEKTAPTTASAVSEAAALLKLLADETRLRLINFLAREDSYVELLASRLDLAPATVCYHLKKLESAGLVRCSRDQFYIIYSLNRAAFDRSLSDLVLVAPPAPAPDAAYEEKVLRTFFRYGKLVRLPSQLKKQTIVLRAIVEHFDMGVDYPEPAVNTILVEFYDDVCTLRRALISAGLMTRTASAPGKPDIYRRTEQSPP